MKVIYLHQYFNLRQNSGGTRSYEMARRLIEYGHEVHMITSERSQSGERRNGWRKSFEEGIEVHWLPVTYSNYMTYRERLRAFLRFACGAAMKAASLRGDVVLATSTPLTIAIPGIFASKRLKIPMVFEVRDLWPQIPIAVGAIKGLIPIKLARWLENMAYINSAAIVALSPGMRDGIVSSGYPASRVHVIPNSADLEFFDVPVHKGREFRANHEWLQDRPLVVYTGTLGMINGVTYMVELAAAVMKVAPEVRFLAIGNGCEEEKIMQAAQRMGVLNRNFFMMRPLPKTEIPMVLSAADVATSFVIDIPELWANSANKFFDALASGTPMAINYEGWQADLLRRAGAGVVLPPNDVNKASQILTTFLSDGERREYASRAARDLAYEEFDRNQMARKLEAVLLSAVEEGSRDPLPVGGASEK